ncbi:bacteriohemerythrin [Halarcobacter bivalviorum]|uniref:Hemerythrin (Two domain) n=1 Tax=Halarcobacter bivalviorum TaxID=663364 RepID=A0AAX2A9T0_9BACT|nr:hemerythrin family protein [Halarcobacter bivalviorum]AXH13561.1 hemerythrin (two domain) [Halarcobacter bivalviorum]RXK09833.1 hypothetical protein CRV05_08875 [Halarcobacter bivalviorum]
MEALIWKTEYNIGHFKIDNEHKKLFNIAKKAYQLSSTKATSFEMEPLKEIIKELFQYVSTHFMTEEEYMSSINYPYLAKHKLIHKKLINILKEMISNINSLEIEEINSKLNEFINEYFITHIITEDKKIKLFKTPIEDLRKSFGWKKDYLVHEKFIDEEHKELFDIATEAFNITQNENKKEKIKDILNRLYSYMKTHFQREEEFMKKINYPKLKYHHACHEKIINDLTLFVRDSSFMQQNVLEKELARIIDISLVQHIIQEDRKITSWIKLCNN